MAVVRGDGGACALMECGRSSVPRAWYNDWNQPFATFNLLVLRAMVFLPHGCAW